MASSASGEFDGRPVLALETLGPWGVDGVRSMKGLDYRRVRGDEGWADSLTHPT